MKICNLIGELIAHFGHIARKTLHEVLGEHFDTFVLNRRLASYAPGTVNNDVIYLQSLGKEIERVTGVSVAGGLEQEAADTAERLPFAFAEVVRIFGALEIMGELAREWTTFLLTRQGLRAARQFATQPNVSKLTLPCRSEALPC